MLLLTGLASYFAERIWHLTMAAIAIFVVRMIWTGLWRVYPAFTAFLAVNLIQQLVRLAFPAWKADLYRAGSAISMPFVILALWELTRMGFAKHPALATFSRRASWHFMGACAVVGALNLFLDPTVPPDRSAALHYFMSMERAITTGLLLFVVALVAFMSWFPVPMRRNVALFLYGFCAIFAAQWVTLLVSNRAPGLGYILSGFLADGVVLVCVLYWTFRTGPGREHETTVTGRRWNEAEMSRVCGQLDAIHARLVRLNQ